MVGIQADDLTGACDVAAAFAGRGLATLVLLADRGAPAAPVPPPEILVLDTESRGLPGPEARARARSATARLEALAPSALYKKVDSTLRGRVADELLGSLDGSGLAGALLAPAFPAQRRVVVDGILRVDGRPVDQEPVARDPTFPATGASVLALLGEGGPHPAGALPLATVRRGAAAVRERLDRWAVAGGRALVCDAETEADLDALAAGAAGFPALLAGSAGLARALANRMGRPGPPAPRPRGLRLPLLVVAGSTHPATRLQVERLAARGAGDGILSAPTTTDDTAATRAAVATRLADEARRRLERGSPCPATLLLTGGETAVAACRALGASGLAVAGELEPGLALGALWDGPFAGLTIVTKAGGFGDADTLVRVWEACR
jgi:uncharacterized protein YgbK (DUF1537 family)